MNRWHGFAQLLLSRLREFYREPEALFWVYGFPILLAIGLGLAFNNREVEPPKVAIQGTPSDTAVKALADYLKSQRFDVEVLDERAARESLAWGKKDLVIVLQDRTLELSVCTVGLPGSPGGQGPLLVAAVLYPQAPYQFYYDKSIEKSVLAYKWADDVLLRKEHPRTPEPAAVAVEEPGHRYIDFLIPGLLGLNLMGGGLWGVGFVLVNMRIRKLLKRLLATPMRQGDFLLAILTSRLVFLIPDMVFLLFAGWLMGVQIRGNPLLLILVVIVGAASFSGLGLLIACRANKTETISGLMNLVMLPMWVLSGSFFDSERYPDFMQPFIQALPLTQLNFALREVMLKNASLLDIGWRLLILIAWGTVSFALALKFFRWR